MAEPTGSRKLWAISVSSFPWSAAGAERILRLQLVKPQIQFHEKCLGIGRDHLVFVVHQIKFLPVANESLEFILKVASAKIGGGKFSLRPGTAVERHFADHFHPGIHHIANNCSARINGPFLQSQFERFEDFR